MSKYHTPSLTFSIAIHAIAIVIIVFVYKYANNFMQKIEQEKRVCVNLNLCVPQREEIPVDVKPPQKQQVKKIVKTSKKIKTIAKKRVLKVKKEVKIAKKVKPKSKIKVKPKVVVKKAFKKIPKEKVTIKKVEQTPEIEPQIVEKSLIQKAIKKPTALPEKTTQEIYINNHIQEISQLLSENLYYPRRARKRGIVGEVIVKFTLSKNAIVSDIHIKKSQSELLSRAAKKTIQDLSGKFPRPEEVIVLQVPIVFSLK